MPTASLEAMLELWSRSLRDVKHQIRPLFAAPSVARSAGAFLDGLLGAERRKTGWMRAEAAGDPGPWRQQAVLGRSQWDADALRDIVREHVVETLAEFRRIDRWGRLGATALDPQSVNAILKARCVRAGLDPALFSAHGLRSGFMTEAGKQGVPLPEAMQLSQHRSVQQAARYYNEAEIDKGKAVRLI